MPLYKTITVSSSTKVLIWKIEESFEQLMEGTKLTQNSQERVDKMKSDIHKRGYLSIRKLLALEGYTDFDLIYSEAGKPTLKDGKFISITHSFQFTSIIVSTIKVGVDIEKQRQKIHRIAHKFTPIQEYRMFANADALMRKLTIVWGAKESVYKSFGKTGVSFLKDIYVHQFSLEDKITKAEVSYKGKSETYSISYLEFEGFTCVYALVG